MRRSVKTLAQAHRESADETSEKCAKDVHHPAKAHEGKRRRKKVRAAAGEKIVHSERTPASERKSITT